MKEGKKIYYTWKQFDDDVKKILKFIKRKKIKVKWIYGIPKGGLVLGVALANHLKVPLFTQRMSLFKCVRMFYKKEELKHILVVDDVSDTGGTMLDIPDIIQHYTVTLHKKKRTQFTPDFWCREIEQDTWIIYPWEPKK